MPLDHEAGQRQPNRGRDIPGAGPVAGLRAPAFLSVAFAQPGLGEDIGAPAEPAGERSLDSMIVRSSDLAAASSRPSRAMRFLSSVASAIRSDSLGTLQALWLRSCLSQVYVMRHCQGLVGQRLGAGQPVIVLSGQPPWRATSHSRHWILPGRSIHWEHGGHRP